MNVLCRQRYSCASFHVQKPGIKSTNPQPPMKKIQVHQAFVGHAVPSRLGRTNMSLAFIAVMAACLSAGSLAQAQLVNLLFLPLTNAPATVITSFPSSTSLGGVSVALSAYNAAGNSTDFEGAAGSGVNGLATGAAAMSTTNGDGGTQPANATGSPLGSSANAANSAADLGDANLGFGAINNFVVTFWFNELVQPASLAAADAGQLVLPRPFVLSTGGSPGENDGSANSIGVKFQQQNEFIFSFGGASVKTLTTPYTSDFASNKWYFVAWVYDGTNIYQYTGSDTTAATLQNQASAPGVVVTLANPSTLVLANRSWKAARGLDGWMEDFRFYTNGPATVGPNAALVESIRKSIAPKIPTITGIYPDGTALMQATNTLVFTAQSSSGFNITNIDLKLNGNDVSGGLTIVSGGPLGSSTTVTASYSSLPQQTINTAVMTASDAIGLVGTASVTFDTFNPTNFVVKAEEFDYNGGLFIDNPDYTATNGDPNSYFGLEGTEGIDVHKGQSTGDNQATDYRYDDGSGTDTQTPLSTGELPWPKFPPGLTDAAGNPIQSHMIGNWSSAEWQNYTKTFPVGNYNVYARLTTSSGSTVTFDQVTFGQGTANQTLSQLGKFTYTGSGAFQWVPLLQNGTLAVVSFGGVPTVATVRTTTGGGANADFYMLVPANPNRPTISNVYPDGNFLFEPTNALSFTVSSPAGINTANITLTLNGTNVSAGLAFSGGPNTWNVSYPGLQTNQTYATVISVTDNNSASANATLNIDTWNPVLQVEAEDFDFNPTKSIIPNGTGFRYIDNPVPTPPLVAAANSYEGQVGDTFIDEQGNNLNNGLSPIQNAYAGATFSNYRTNDPCAAAPVTDTPRRQFTPGSLDYNVGFLGPGHWEQYTRTWPSGTYNLYGRMASGANLGTLYSSWSQVIAGWGTTNQVTRHIGSFAIPSTGGYSSYFYTPLIDRFGNYVQMTLGGTNTFRDTHLVYNQTETPDLGTYGINVNFYMLLNARTDLPRIDNVYPDGSVLMQQTNKLSFVASSPTYGMSTANIHVTLNGTDISSQLVFSGGPSTWNVSYPGLQPNTAYTAVITVTDNNNQTHSTTVNFDTFNQNNFTWEAEDYDFDPTLSPVSNGSGLRYIDNPVPTSAPAANSYLGQQGDSGTDYSAIFQNILGTYVYRPFDLVSTEVTGDATRQKYQDARLQGPNPYINDYDVDLFTNWIDYTRTFPSGNFLVYARLSAGNGAFNLQCAQVTGGAGTSMQVSNVLGNFIGSGTSFATWQYVPLTNATTGSLVILSLGGVETLQMTGDDNENANFFMLVSAVPAITASLSGANIILSFPTVSGLNYTVSWKNNLTDPSWTPLGSPMPGNGAAMSVNDSLSHSQRFYRLAVQ
jgi:hypothetical protein